MAAVRAGVGREVAHEAIKEHAVAVALEMREKATAENDLLDRLGADERLGLDPAAVDAVVADPLTFVGRAPAQVRELAAAVERLVAADPEAARYTPGAIL
ncbi:MAG: adenylosuccinate lyase, partial [Acidimicrobiales bacterium]|nr:adenylosuccinate lyase [Acidimicrobiales bacterium]